MSTENRKNSRLNSKTKPKIGVFVVTYNATTTITKVLSRIKPSTWKRISEVFIFDDSSSDNTSAVVYQYKKGHKLNKVRIFKNHVNLGYGGNQKRGYLYAIKNNFDIVVLLHGDGQYAPEVMDNLIDPIAQGKADAVFGSRMIHKNRALKGGMPLYKFLGNKILTNFQNFVMNKKMSEYHSGYRAYGIQALKQIPFLKNSNDFHFDNEIIIQLLYGNFKIKEVPIPTYYGGEICYVNGLFYAWNVFKTIILYRLHRAGLVYIRQFDLKGGAKYSYKQNRYSSHNIILSIISSTSNGKKWRILDIGCGSGFLAARIKKLGHHVVGVDVYDNSEARKSCDKFYVTDIEKNIGIADESHFDCIIMADIIEHTRNPEEILLQIRNHLKPDGIIVMSTGNVANLYIRLKLLMGNFEYTERGILDNTHYHLFTTRSSKNLLQNCGFRILRNNYTPIPFELVIPDQSYISDALCLLNMLAIRLLPSIFSYQIILLAALDSKATELLRYQEINKPQFIEYDSAKSPLIPDNTNIATIPHPSSLNSSHTKNINELKQ